MAGQDLQGRMPAEGLLLGLVNHAHAAPAHLAEDAEVAQPLGPPALGLACACACRFARARLDPLDEQRAGNRSRIASAYWGNWSMYSARSGRSPRAVEPRTLRPGDRPCLDPTSLTCSWLDPQESAADACRELLVSTVMDILVSLFNRVADIQYRAAGHHRRTVSAGERDGEKGQVLRDRLGLARRRWGYVPARSSAVPITASASRECPGPVGPRRPPAAHSRPMLPTSFTALNSNTLIPAFSATGPTVSSAHSGRKLRRHWRICRPLRYTLD